MKAKLIGSLLALSVALPATAAPTIPSTSAPVSSVVTLGICQRFPCLPWC